MIDAIIGAAFGLLIGTIIGVYVPELLPDPKICTTKTDEQDLFTEHEQQPIVNEEVETEPEAVSQADGYAVSGTPRHVPWSRRKKELEASARQKRRQLESFREEDNG